MSYHDTSDDSSELPPIFLDLLQHSCLIPALCSYLRNDSGMKFGHGCHYEHSIKFEFLYQKKKTVLDITRHIPLYRAILQLLRAMSLSNRLVTLLMPSRRNDMSIATLLVNMKLCVDTYASRLKYEISFPSATNMLKVLTILPTFFQSQQKVQHKRTDAKGYCHIG